MERLTSDSLHSPAAEKKPASYYSYTRPSLNGYTTVASSSAATDENSDSEPERVGVFDYVLSASPHNIKSRSSYSSTISTAPGEDDPGGSDFRHRWAQDMNSPADNPHCNNGTELTTFRYGSDVRSRSVNDSSSHISAATDRANGDTESSSELEEVVVHSEVQSHRATYERFNPEFPYPGVCCSSSVHEPSTVFVTSVNKSSSQGNAEDEGDAIERRSRQCTPLRKSTSMLLFTVKF